MALAHTSHGPASALLMWEPYAQLFFQNRPVDLIVINSSDHVLSSPAARLASQGGDVDWFRFWLQGYEDPDQSRSEQYRRREKLCDMQVTRIRINPHAAS